MHPLAKAEYDRINRVAGATGPLDELRWASSERANYEVRSNEFHENGRLSNGTFVGVHNPTNGVAVDNLTVRNVEIAHSQKWAMRPYEWRDNITLEDVTVCGVLEEHGLYPTMIGRGTYRSTDQPPKAQPSLSLIRCRWEYIGSQALQLTGPRHLYGQTVGTAPNGTGFPFKQADTRGGHILIKDNFARAACNWGTRAAFAYSIRESKQDVIVDGLVLDNRGFRNQGGVLFEGPVSNIGGKLPWFPRRVDARRMVVQMGTGTRALLQSDHISYLRILESAFYSVNEGVIRIQRKPSKPGQLIIDNCVGNARVRIDGDDAGPIEGQRIELKW
jgi:hypothetical protein